MQSKFTLPWRSIATGLLLLAVGAGNALAADTAAPQDAPAETNSKRKHTDILMEGDARCTRCHDDVSDDEVAPYLVLPIGQTKHGVRADKRTPTCVSCHGDSEPHLKQKGKTRPLPDVPFGKKTSSDPKIHDKACLKCHQGEKTMHWVGSVHARRNVPCVGCHQMHTVQDKATTRDKVAEMCISCHKEKRAQIERPSRHQILEGKMVCTDCHNPHGSAGPKLMAKDSVNETCYTCHMEYRGPFLWNHTPVTQDCSICHNPHGTVAAGLLKQRPPFLCQQCHEPTSHRGNFPGITGVNSFNPGQGALTQARGCPNCHTNIHGGSNATNHTTSRTGRR